LFNTLGGRYVDITIEELLIECKEVLKERTYRKLEDINRINDMIEKLILNEKIFGNNYDGNNIGTGIMKWMYNELTEEDLHTMTDLLAELTNSKREKADILLGEYSLYDELLDMTRGINTIIKDREK